VSEGRGCRPVSREHGIYVRANACWTPHAMMEAITRELGLAPTRRTAAMLDLVVERMVQEERSLGLLPKI